jgi:hypothetical protein
MHSVSDTWLDYEPNRPRGTRGATISGEKRPVARTLRAAILLARNNLKTHCATIHPQDRATRAMGLPRRGAPPARPWPLAWALLALAAVAHQVCAIGPPIATNSHHDSGHSALLILKTASLTRPRPLPPPHTHVACARPPPRMRLRGPPSPSCPSTPPPVSGRGLLPVRRAARATHLAPQPRRTRGLVMPYACACKRRAAPDLRAHPHGLSLPLRAPAMRTPDSNVNTLGSKIEWDATTVNSMLCNLAASNPNLAPTCPGGSGGCASTPALRPSHDI